MSHTFYPLKNNPWPSVGLCPHAGGASIAALVLQGNDSKLSHRYLHGTMDAERERNRLLFLENENLKAELEQVKLELKRQNKFATHKQKQAATEPEGDTRPFLPSQAFYLQNVIGIS